MNYNPDIRTALERLLQLRQTDTHALLGSDWHNAFEAASRAFYAHATDISKLPLQERQDLAYNPNTPLEILTLLARDEDVVVRLIARTTLKEGEGPSVIELDVVHRDAVRCGVPVGHTAAAACAGYKTAHPVYKSAHPVKVLKVTPDISKLPLQERKELARNPNTPPETLAILAQDEDEYMRNRVAWNHNTTPEILTLLARDKDSWVHRGVAQNPNTSPETLTLLARDEDWGVRWGVARNPNAPPETLTLLARDESVGVRWGVARNPNAPPETLTLLARDENVQVRRAATQNPNYISLKELKVTAKQYEALKKLLAASQDEDLKSILSNLN
jgi:hypothetical protein